MTTKERPILMSAPMVLATLRNVDPKTVTRRTRGLDRINEAPDEWEVVHKYQSGDRYFFHNRRSAEDLIIKCPYGKPGDRLWVKETFFCDHSGYPNDAPQSELLEYMDYRATHDCRSYEAGCPCRDDQGRGHWKPSIHMFRWASRILLEITEIDCQRVQDISYADAVAEGFEREPELPIDPRDWFRDLWESIKGPGAWKRNDHLWPVRFKGVKP